jgi:hypothetical protein
MVSGVSFSSKPPSALFNPKALPELRSPNQPMIRQVARNIVFSSRSLVAAAASQSPLAFHLALRTSSHFLFSIFQFLLFLIPGRRSLVAGRFLPSPDR